jgi:DNA-binding IclR family transcriptional regulator
LGDIIAAINLSGPDAIMQAPGVLEHSRTLLLSCAQSISAEMGYRKTEGKTVG